MAKKRTNTPAPAPESVIPSVPLTSDILRNGLLAWIAETEAQISHVAGQLGEGGALARVMGADAKATRKHLALAAQAMLNAVNAATQLVTPLFLLDAEGGA